MKKLLIVTILFVCAASLQAAQQWYQFPETNILTDKSRLLVYSSPHGNNNITGLQLKQELSAYAHLSSSRRIANANQIFDLMTTGTTKKLIKRAAPGAGDYDRVMEIKDSAGKIVYWVNASGQMIFGTPTPLSIASIYPANGATNVSNGIWADYSSTGGGRYRINTTTPAVTFNKTTGVSISLTYIVGSSIAPVGDGGSNTIWSFGNFSGAAGQTYTMRVLRGSIGQTDGESSSSCGTAMTDMAGICMSTFTMKP